MSLRELHLNVHPVAAGNHPGAWRWPGADPVAFARIEGYLEWARIAERGTLDAIFLADVPGLHADITDYPVVNGLEPSLIMGAIATVTERIGLVATLSTTYNEPFNAARRLRALDLISHGRAGWNAVTTSGPRVAHNFVANELSSEQRYDRAAEFVAVVLDLWRSWAPDGLVLDRARGRYADMAKIAPINHVGEHFSVRGPLSLPPSEQGYPVVFHAGVSDAVHTLAARSAEAMFGAVADRDTSLAELTEIRRRAVTFGRPADSVLFFPGLITTIGGTEEEALRRRGDLDELYHLAGAADAIAVRLGLPPGVLELDRPVPATLRERLVVPADHTRPTVLLAKQGLTVRDILRRGGGSHHVNAVGTPEQVADLIADWYSSGAVDGFTVMPDVTFDGLPAFVDHVVPELRRRGLFRTEYRGATLREHYGLELPDVAVPGGVSVALAEVAAP